jgi:hypothetical protein
MLNGITAGRQCAVLLAVTARFSMAVDIDRLLGADAAEPFRSLIGERRAPVRLRTTGRDQGPVDPLWRVIVNASTTPEPQGSQ